MTFYDSQISKIATIVDTANGGRAGLQAQGLILNSLQVMTVPEEGTGFQGVINLQWDDGAGRWAVSIG